MFHYFREVVLQTKMRVTTLKAVIIFIALSGCLTPVKAQQDLLYLDQQWLQKPLYNPAASGISNKLEVNLGSYIFPDFTRNSLFGTSVRVDGFIDKIKSGFGVSYYVSNTELRLKEDANNYFSTFVEDFKFNYNYQFQLKNSAVLAVGANFMVSREYWYSANFPAGSLPKDGMRWRTGVGFGLVYSGNHLNLGLSLLPVFNIKQEYFIYEFKNQLFINASYRFVISEKWEIEPMLLVTGNGSKNEYNFSVKTRFNKVLDFGLGTTNGNIITGFAGITISKKFALNYAYGYIASNFTNAFAAQHSITLRYFIAK